MSGELHDGREEALEDDAEAEGLIADTFVEVFSTDNEFVARMVIDDLLRPQGIAPALHDRRSHSMPAPAAMAGTLGVAVPDRDAEKARQLLRDAQNDKILYGEGQDGHIVGETVK